jgi:hypothetical protein
MSQHSRPAWAVLGSCVAFAGCVQSPPNRAGVAFALTFPAAAHAQPVTGRAYVIISRDSDPEPRLEAGSVVQTVPFFGADVSELKPGTAAIIGDTTLGYPIAHLRDLPAGDYYVQGLLNVYTQVRRSDGKTIWVHWDQGEGQRFNRSPGNLYSVVQRVHLDPKAGYEVTLSLANVIPAIPPPVDTKWVKHVKIASTLLSKFWGQPVYLGATVLLPQGYDTHRAVRYPVIYEQGHFGLDPPLEFSPERTPLPPGVATLLKRYNLETGYDLAQSWSAPSFPRMIAVTFQHPTPYFDDSYAVNSANNGPYGDAILTELIPYLETHFRMIRRSYARVLTGGSTGGWESLALQVFHPDFFGGTWTLYPDPVDFHHYDLVNAYDDTNAFVLTVDHPGAFLEPKTEWLHPERPIMRANDGQLLLTVRQFSQLEEVLGTHGRAGEQLAAWEAVYGPVGADGYPKSLWDKRTGHIDHAVAQYMKDHGYDLRAYLERNWTRIGRTLVDKIHVDVGDMDNFYLNLAVYDLDAFLSVTKHPAARATFRYGRPEKGHGWQHTSRAGLVREMAAFIAHHAPRGENTRAWQYR